MRANDIVFANKHLTQVLVRDIEKFRQNKKIILHCALGGQYAVYPRRILKVIKSVVRVVLKG